MILIKEKVKQSVFFSFLVFFCFILSLEMVHHFEEKELTAKILENLKNETLNLYLKFVTDVFGNNFLSV